MANPVYVLPDPVLATLQYLRGIPEVTALVPAGSIVTVLPAQPAYPYILVSNAGGQAIWPAVDDAAVQVDCLSNAVDGEVQAANIARTVRAAIWAIANDIVAAGVLASGAEEIAPQWMPDTIPVPPVARFTARYRITLHN